MTGTPACHFLVFFFPFELHFREFLNHSDIQTVLQNNIICSNKEENMKAHFEKTRLKEIFKLYLGNPKILHYF